MTDIDDQIALAKTALNIAFKHLARIQQLTKDIEDDD